MKRNKIIFYIYISTLFLSTFTLNSQTKISPPLPLGASVSDCKITLDGLQVIYLADQDNLGTKEIYSISVSGGTSTKLNSVIDPSSGGSIKSFKISPNGNTIVFVGDLDIDEKNELYKMSINGGQITKISGNIPEFSDVVNSDLEITPDSNVVVFRADIDSDGVFELFSVPINGGPVVKLNDTITTGDINYFEIAPNSSYVVFRVNSFLYRVPINGGAKARVNHLPSFPYLIGDDFEISPNSNYVLYSLGNTTTNIKYYYTIPIANNDAEITLGTIGSAKFTNNNKVVYFNANLNTDLGNFYLVNSDGTNNIMLDPQQKIVAKFDITPSSDYLIYMGREENEWPTALNLYSIALPTGGSSIDLSGDANHIYGGINDFEIYNNGTILYKADMEYLYRSYLYSVSPNTNNSVKINGILPPSYGNVNKFDLSFNGQTIVFTADEQADYAYELFSSDNPILSINDSSFKKIGIHPNPFTDKISITSNQKIESLELYNKIGQLVLKPKLREGSIDLSAINAGLYFLKLYSDNSSVIKKLIKK